MSDEKATLMMVTYNRLDLTKKTLNNIIKTTNFPYSIVIVDNCSSDGTQNYLLDWKNEALNSKNKYINDIKIICNDDNIGIAKARNQCLCLADELDTTWYSTLDNDVLLPDGWLKECVDILSENSGYGMIGVSFEPTVYQIVKSGNHEFERKPNGNLGTACTVFHKRFHQMLGFFNTEYGLYGEEDADMGMRARAAGFQLGYITRHGQHIGEGEADIGEYREFKDQCRKKNLDKFYKNCRMYIAGKKSIYVKCNK